jgi:hypothetical protein
MVLLQQTKNEAIDRHDPCPLSRRNDAAGPLSPRFALLVHPESNLLHEATDRSQDVFGIFARVDEVMAELHDRMPVILVESDWAKWLGQEAATDDGFALKI